MKIDQLENHTSSHPVIVDNFLSDSDVIFLTEGLSKIENSTPNPNIRGGLGIENTFLASKIGMDNPIIPISQNNEINMLGLELTKIMIRVRDMMSDFFNKNMSLKQFNYVNMLPGSSNGPHFDSHNDGEGAREYAALLYLNEEYDGGLIRFPDLDLSIKPKQGTLIYFKGDENMVHEVTEVKSGQRKNLVMFFGSPEKVDNPEYKFQTYANQY